MALKNLKEKIHYLFLYKNYLSYLENFTFIKLSNALYNSYEYKLKKIKLNSYPSAYGIDIGNFCNLKCPLCPTGKNNPNRKKKFMFFDEYKTIFDKIKKYAFVVNLYNWGEPFLNKDILKIIEYTKKNKVGVLLSTNLNYMTDEIIDSIIKLKLDKIVISLDGVSQETYGAYRKGGDFNKVMENLKKIIKRKKELNSKYPRIVWQYLISKKNEKDVGKAKELSKELGIKINFLYMRTSQLIKKKGEKINEELVKEWVSENFKGTSEEASSTINTKGVCSYPFKYLFVNPEGTTSPCCALYDQKTDFGDLLKTDLKELWNNKKYVSARSRFSKKKPKEKVFTICDICDSVKP
jgi:MoaA/NifB/PqqE/SkfB family radical SAM enzyme